jgi:hypothetical protein
MAVERAKKAYGMPWRSSIYPSYKQVSLLYALLGMATVLHEKKI